MIKPSSSLSNIKIITAINAANLLIQNPEFYKRILKKRKQFDMSDASNKKIVDYLKANRSTVNLFVRSYYKRFTRANAYFEPSNPMYININTAKLNRSTGSVAATIIHEWIHANDKFDLFASYGHKGNSAKGKMNTAPNWIANLAKEMIDGGAAIEDVSTSIKVKIGFWGSIKRFFRRFL